MTYLNFIQYKPSFKLGLLLLACFLLSSCQPAPSLKGITLSGPTMGTEYRISLVLPNSVILTEEELNQGVLARMNAVNESMSTYIPDSELNRFNANEAKEIFSMSPALQTVMTEAWRLSAMTEGAFDATVKPIVDFWGFGPAKGTQVVPTHDIIDQLKTNTGYDKVVLSKQNIHKKIGNVTVDLSAIAKGYAVDKVATYLQQQGINNYLINIGGELKASGHNKDQHIWRIGIEKPAQLGGVQQIIELSNKAIATSGDYRNFVVIDGKAYSHTIDPRVAQPVNHQLASVSVITDHAMTADGLATALMVMGEESGWSFAQQHDLAAYFIVRTHKDEKNTYEVRFTDKFAPYLKK